MKKILSVMLTVLLSLQMIAIPAFAANTTEVVFSDADGARGGTVAVTVSVLEPTEAYNSVGIRDLIVYDKNDPDKKAVDDITFKSFTTNTSLGALFNQADDAKQSINIGYMAASAYVLDPAVTINYDVASDAAYGEYGVSATVIMKNSSTELKVEIVDGTITIADNRTEITGLSMEDKSVTYDGNAKSIDVTGTIPTGAMPKYTITKMVEGKEVSVDSAVDAGEYKVTATVTGADYKDWTESATLTITPKEVTISGITAADKTYDGTTAVEVNTENAEIDGVIAGDDVDATFPEVTLPSADAGSYTLDFSGTVLTGEDAANYEITEIEEVTVSVSKINVTVKIDDVTKKVGVDLPPTLTYTVDPEEPFVGDTILTGEPAVEEGWKDEAGKEYTINKGTLDIEPADQRNNYNITFVEGKLNITEANLTGITVKADDTFKTAYYEGEIFIADGLTITASYDNDTTAPVAANLCKISPAIMPPVEQDGTKQIITIEYNGKTATVEVTVNKDDITVIDAVIADANKVVWVGDDVVIESVTATYESGNTNGLDSTLYDVAYDTSAKAEGVNVTVTLKADADISDVETVTVIDKKLAGLEVVETAEGALSKVAGQTFKVADGGVQINALYIDKSGNVTKDDVTAQYSDVTVTSAKADTVTKTLKYNDEAFGAYVPEEVSTDLVVVFAAKVVDKVEVLTKPTKTEYIEGTDFDPAGIVVKVTYNDGDSVEADSAEEFAANGITFTPKTLELGDEAVVVACGGKTASVAVTVIPRTLTGIEVTVNKDEYMNGEAFNKADITVMAVYDNGAKEAVTDYTVDKDVFTLTDAGTAETQTVTVTYGEKEFSYDVTVSAFAAVNETTGKRYEDIDTAFAEAGKNDEISIRFIGENEVVDVFVKVNMIVTNNTGAEITITVNNDVYTIADGDSIGIVIVVEDEEDEEEEDEFNDYYFFYMQMLQWRNRMFKVSLKQTEGGTITAPASVRNGETAEITITPDEGYEIVDVLVNGKSVGAVESYKIRNIKANTTVSAVFEKISWNNPFADIAETDAYYAAIQYVYENGLFKGVSETEFAPATTMTRAMFVTVLGRLCGVNEADYASVSFADCEAGSWYAPFVEWASQAGIVNGYSAEAFGPMDEITVEQAAVILYRYIAYMGYSTAADAELSNYADGDQVSDWAAESMQWALANGIYVSDITLDPQAPAARSLVAEMLYNLSVWMG